ncbi:ferrochelatase [Gracilibacillus halotolerans]|uniref:Ferrochelatase n=1 Tax=Gracilibacillus halotolerans TaxID=74386 RepID=A0A841RQX2_9BACI|nr:ferrochelatase [Gracilibacillus halotolerans]MBB6514013.1 ferrochelatase [Gracilibacillus halotolerans]
MNILVLFSYGSLQSLDDVPGFYSDILGSHATEEYIENGVKLYESHGMPDPLGIYTNRIGVGLIKLLREETGEDWIMCIANHHVNPTIEEVAAKCGAIRPKRVLTTGLIPFDSLTGNISYRKKFEKLFRKDNRDAQLIHAGAFYKNKLFIKTMTRRAQEALIWIPEVLRDEATIIFTAHSMPGTTKAHEEFIRQYEFLAYQIAKSLDIETYHIAYRSGSPPPERWLRPDVMDVLDQLRQQNVPSVIFIEALSIIENLEAIQEITHHALNKARRLQMKAVQTDYLNDSFDFVEAMANHLFKELKIPKYL